MQPYERSMVIDLVKTYFNGGNAQGITSSGVMKAILESIRDFVEETDAKTKE